MKTFVTVLLAVTLSCAADYTLGPDSQPQPGVPKGTVTRYQLPPGKFYPGTPHNYSLYIPAQYDAAKPTPFMIYLDGSGALGNGTRVPVVFDNLIAKHDLPPMIGIFIDPGVLPAATPDAQSRFERVFEYDSMSDRFASFLIEELIPEVAKKYNLSKSPDDRGLSGNSTGAVGAFMAAWNRPDQFHRVLSFIGTYVAMKGADSLPALVRRTEPKPIRVFLQDGKIDHIVPGQPWGTFYAGSWPINNQVMFEAFQFAGYDVKLEMGDEGHSGRHGAAIMPDALRWLWRDYPQPVAVHEPASMMQKGYDPRGRVYSIVTAEKPWERLGGEYSFLFSPVGDKDGNLFFADGSGRIFKADAGGKVSLFRENVLAMAIAVGPDGRLLASLPGRHRIMSYGPADEKVVAENVDATAMAVTAQGSIYFLNAFNKGIGIVNPQGQSRMVWNGGGLANPHAIALSPDQAMMIVTDAQMRYSWSLQIMPDGSLANGEPFYRLEVPESGWTSGVEGVTEDSAGQVYFATPLGIQVCEANGRVAAILNAPEHGPVSSLAFGGKDFDWLYVTQGGRIYRRPVKVNGVPAWAPAKLPKPPL
jgi:gluconolactonase